MTRLQILFSNNSDDSVTVLDSEDAHKDTNKIWVKVDKMNLNKSQATNFTT